MTIDNLIEQTQEIEAGIETIQCDVGELELVKTENDALDIQIGDKDIDEDITPLLYKAVGGNKNVFGNVADNLGFNAAKSLFDDYKKEAREDREADNKKMQFLLSNDEIIGTPHLKNPGFSNTELLEVIKNTLETKEISYEVSEQSFVDPTTARLNLNVVLPDNIDIFRELGLTEGYDDDLYKIGLNLVNSRFTPHQTTATNYIERLICENGMTADFFNYKIRASNKEPMKRFAKKLDKTLGSDEFIDAFRHHMLEKFHGLYTNQASVRELEFFIEALNDSTFDQEKEEEGRKLLEDFKYSVDLDRLYGETVANKSKFWKSTANSGVKAYDLLNIATYLNSHYITGNSQMINNSMVINSFFSKDPDLMEIAPIVKSSDDPLKDIRKEFKLN